ncbi:unnamed protein product [Pleuronectes platessa]|uniref:Uncharacterized protein n=1 Tax=Pleuronectes platessa TaxID=8262 RepID=A0A9N7YKK2_PLEPL|nr:unnamed protein product [Pleuronectes platessa]
MHDEWLNFTKGQEVKLYPLPSPWHETQMHDVSCLRCNRKVTATPPTHHPQDHTSLQTRPLLTMNPPDPRYTLLEKDSIPEELLAFLPFTFTRLSPRSQPPRRPPKPVTRGRKRICMMSQLVDKDFLGIVGFSLRADNNTECEYGRYTTRECAEKLECKATCEVTVGVRLPGALSTSSQSV